MRYAIAVVLVAGLAAEVVCAQGFAPAQEVKTVLNAGFGSRQRVVDFNRDGLMDVVFAVSDETQPGYPRYLGVALGLARDAGGPPSFADPVVSRVAGNGFPYFDDYKSGLALGDLDEDGFMDVVTNQDYPFSANGPNLAVLFGGPGGTLGRQLNLANAPDQYLRPQNNYAIALADINRDGHLDIITPAQSGVSVLLGTGHGAFSAPILSATGGYSDFTLVGDLDGDGNLDVVFVLNVGTDSRANCAFYPRRGDGTGHFTNGVTGTFPARLNIIHTGEPRSHMADLNGDGKAEIIIFGESGGQTGAGGIGIFTALPGFPLTLTRTFLETRSQDSRRTGTIEIGDFDGDGDVDIFKMPAIGRTGEVMLNDGAGGFAARSPVPASDAAWFSAAVGDVAGNGLPDVVVINSRAEDSTPQRLAVLTNLFPAPSACGSADFNHDGDTGTDADIEAFFRCLAGTCCAACGTADFNADGDMGTDQDIEAFFRVLAGGTC